MELYHASKVGGIQILEPRISNHGIPQIYFSDKRENVLVYLSNAVEKYCKEMGFVHHGPWRKWASYGFDREGRLQLEEYYPNALWDTYKGVSGFLYTVHWTESIQPMEGIRDAFVAMEPVAVQGMEFIPDAYESILLAEQEGRISLVRYENLPREQLEWLRHTILREYEASAKHPDYRHFLLGKFPDFF